MKHIRLSQKLTWRRLVHVYSYIHSATTQIQFYTVQRLQIYRNCSEYRTNLHESSRMRNESCTFFLYFRIYAGCYQLPYRLQSGDTCDQRAVRPTYFLQLTNTRQSDIYVRHLSLYYLGLLLEQKRQDAPSVRLLHLSGTACPSLSTVQRHSNNFAQPCVHIIIDWLSYTDRSRYSTVKRRRKERHQMHLIIIVIKAQNWLCVRPA
jgi:hypothetical protein